MFLSLTALPLALWSFVVVPPVSGTVIERFERPRCERCAGHRGVTIASTDGDTVVASVSGDIVFAGEVGGHLYVVQELHSRVKITYGWLRDIVVARRALGSDARSYVQMGQAIAIAGPRTYLGVRVSGHYVEPLSYLGLTGKRLTGHGGIVVGQRGLAR